MKFRKVAFAVRDGPSYAESYFVRKIFALRIFYRWVFCQFKSGRVVLIHQRRGFDPPVICVVELYVIKGFLTGGTKNRSGVQASPIITTKGVWVLKLYENGTKRSVHLCEL